MTATFKDSRGQRVSRTTVGVPAGTRQTIDANTLSGATAGPFSVTLNATARIAAEETHYFGGSPNSGAYAGGWCR